MSWQLVSNSSEILAVHAAYLHSGQILYFGGDQHDPKKLKNQQYKDSTRLFDCNSQLVSKVPSPGFDDFCSGHALLEHGLLLVAGGTAEFNEQDPGLHHAHFPGLKDGAIFQLDQNQVPVRKWAPVALFNSGQMAPICLPGQVPERDECVLVQNPNLTGGRWYPTLLTLGTGDVLAVSGHPGSCDKHHNNFIPEVYTANPAPLGQWHRLGDFENDEDLNRFLSNSVTYYPRLHLLPTGDVFCSSPIAGRSKSISVNTSNWTATFHEVGPFNPSAQDQKWDVYGGISATSVLLPLLHENGFSPRVLICGAEQPFVIDLANWDPNNPALSGQYKWYPTPGSRVLAGSPRRLNLNATFLPTGEVFVSGGVAGQPTTDADGNPVLAQLDATATKNPEIYDPYKNTWTPVNDPAQIVRNYHSVALLMPDGRVWTAGSDRDAGRGDAAAVLDIEIYEPWFYGNPNRPYITAAPDHFYPGDQVVVRSTQAPEIIRVVMVRCGTCTHAFNPDQRFVSLKFKYKGSDILLVDAPPTNNILPTGYYFMYTINKDGLPSWGTTTYVNPDPRDNDRGNRDPRLSRLPL